MITISNKINNDIYIEEDTTLEGQVVGSAIIRPMQTLIVNGIVNGNVIIETGASVEVNGTVYGDIYNQGGVLKKQGRVTGTIHSKES